MDTRRVDTMDADAATRRDPRDVVAVVNTSPDTVDLLQNWLEKAGMVVVVTYTHHVRDGQIDLAAFLRTHQPRVIVYDIAPPYENNLRLYEHIRAMPICEGAHFVLTSTNPARVTDRVSGDQQVYEVVDRDEDLMSLVQAVKEASRARPSR